MTESNLICLLAGIAFGLFNGFISRLILKKAMPAGNSVFFAAWGGGILYRLVFLLASVAFLGGNVKNVLFFALPMIAVQETCLVFALKAKIPGLK